MEGCSMCCDLEKAEYLNVGCGTVRMVNCINMDVADNALVDADIIGSVLDIPFPNERFKGVVFSHVIEHLPMGMHRKALFNIRRVLKEGGTLYLECPDFELATKYFHENHKGRKNYWYQCIYGREEYESDTHRSGLTRQYLTDLLFDCGYHNLKWLNTDDEEALIAVIAYKAEELPTSRI